MQQGTDEWREARMGKVTVSRLSDVMAVGKGGTPSASRANYRAELVLERITGKVQDNGFKTSAMDRGTELEAQARARYSMGYGVEVSEVGFIQHPTIEMFGASPDGLVGEDGGYEGKAQNAASHLAYLSGKAISKGYRDQILGCMACTGRRWWDFHSWHPDFPEEVQSFVHRFDRVETEIVAAEREVRKFLTEVDEEEAKLRAMMKGRAA